jgi:nitrogen fixation/metabolism regulation signal transduction histidine kinase
MIIVYLVAMAVTVAVGWAVLKNEAIEVAKQKTELFTAAMNANRRYMMEHLRPRTKELLPKTYFPEGSVGIFMLSSIGRMLQEEHPEYVYRIASRNALNPANLADREEARILQLLQRQEDPNWEGFIERDGKTFFAVAKSMKAKKGCLRCHSDPDVAPKKLVAEYGTDGGFGYKPGKIVGATFAYVPLSVALEQARHNLMVFVGGFSLFFLLVLFIIDRILVSSVVRPIEHFVETADAVSTGDLNRQFKVNSQDEMHTLAEAFKRMQISIQKSIDILRRRK